MGENHHDEVENDFLNPHKHEQYNLNSKIMLTAIVSLALVVILVTILHLYARCLLRRQIRQRAALRHLGLAVNIPQLPKIGLDPAVIATIPVFPFRQINVLKANDQTECAVCLSVLENDDMARILPNCKHTFHAECIDKWLGSNSTCPICRTEAEPRVVVETLLAESVNSSSMNVEGSTSENGNQNPGKISTGSSRLSSFRRILIRERSSCTIQNCGEEAGIEDLERQ